MLTAKLCLVFVFGGKVSSKEMLASRGRGVKQFLPGSLYNGFYSPQDALYDMPKIVMSISIYHYL